MVASLGIENGSGLFLVGASGGTNLRVYQRLSSDKDASAVE